MCLFAEFCAIRKTLIQKMNKLLIIFFAIILFSCKDEKRMKFTVETNDIENFWIAYDSIQDIKTEKKAKVFTELYYEKASESFKKIIAISGDIANANNYLESFKNYPKFWKSLKLPTLELLEIQKEIEDSYQKIKKVYPKFNPANVCIFMGPRVIEGSVRDRIIFLGAELNVFHNKVDLSEFEKSEIQAHQNDIKSTIIHEAIHFQQKTAGENLLSISIREGSADFLAELFMEEPFHSITYDYGRENERALWEEFSKEMYSNNISKWLYGESGNYDRPMDLGYFIGYMITKSYYYNLEDKKEAIKEIIEVSDFDEFLKRSGYPNKFKR